jgi:hypothetical protein
MDTEHVRPWRRRKYRVAAVAAGAVVVVSAGVLAATYVSRDGRSDTRAGLVATPASSESPPPGTGPEPRQVPVPVNPGSSVVPSVTNSGSLAKERRTLRIVSARGDLTGARELTWVADGGHPVGSARCSQKFRFNPKSAVSEKPTLLICWRTSATRSVYTVAVDLDGRPSEKASVATIDKVWAELG